MQPLTLIGTFTLAAVLSTNAAVTDLEEGTFNFVPLGNNDYSLAADFQIDVNERYTDGIGRSGSITLFNNDPGGSLITTLWLQGKNYIHQETSGLSFDMPIRPLPGGDTIGFNTSLMAGRSPTASGISFGGSYELVDGEGSLFDTPAVAGFASGIYRVAIEVQPPGGQFEYFVNDLVAVPEPSTIMLGAFAMLPLIGQGIKRLWGTRRRM